MSKFLTLTSEGGHEFRDMGTSEFAQANLTPIDTLQRNELAIPAGAIPVVYNSDVSGAQIKVGSTWYTLSTKEYAESLVVGLWDDRGNFDASVNTYPTGVGSGTEGAIMKGDIWTVSVAGTISSGGLSFPVVAGDTIRALENTPGQTNANWAIAEANFGYTAENQANKATDFTTLDNTKYASTQAIENRIIADRTKNGILSNTIADVGTDADLLEKDLKTYTLSGGTLSSNGSYIEVEATLSTGANGDNKSIKLYWGGTLIGVIDAVALNGKTVTIKAKIQRTAAGGQLCTCEMMIGAASSFDATNSSSKITSTTIDSTTEQIIKIAGLNGSATENDVVCKNMIIKHNILNT